MEVTDFTKGIIASGGLIVSTTDTPTRVGSRIWSLEEMPDIPNPSVGQIVYVRSEDRYYSIKSLKSKVYGGLEVHDAMVDTYEPLVKVDTAKLELRVEENAQMLQMLTGAGEGSVLQMVDEAINRFATELSDDGTVNTFKELVDYAASHQSDIAALVVKVDTEVQRNDRQDERIASLELLILGDGEEGKKTLLEVVEEQVQAVQEIEQEIQAQAAEIQNLQQLIGTKPVAAQIDEAFSWDVVV